MLCWGSTEFAPGAIQRANMLFLQKPHACNGNWHWPAVQFQVPFPDQNVTCSGVSARHVDFVAQQTIFVGTKAPQL